jgi:hypothetical protein
MCAKHGHRAKKKCCCFFFWNWGGGNETWGQKKTLLPQACHGPCMMTTDETDKGKDTKRASPPFLAITSFFLPQGSFSNLELDNQRQGLESNTQTPISPLYIQQQTSHHSRSLVITPLSSRAGCPSRSPHVHSSANRPALPVFAEASRCRGCTSNSGKPPSPERPPPVCVRAKPPIIYFRLCTEIWLAQSVVVDNLTPSHKKHSLA